MSNPLPEVDWTVDGLTYRTRVMPSGPVARSLYLRLVQAICPALERLPDLRGTKDPEGALTKILASVLGGLDGKLFEDMCSAMCNNTVMPRADGSGEDSLKAEFGNAHFAGKYTRLMRCIVEFIRANGMLDFLQEISVASHAPTGPTKSG
jgi:hypothetical protein